MTGKQSKAFWKSKLNILGFLLIALAVVEYLAGQQLIKDDPTWTLVLGALIVLLRSLTTTGVTLKALLVVLSLSSLAVAVEVDTYVPGIVEKDTSQLNADWQAGFEHGALVKEQAEAIWEKRGYDQGLAHGITFMSLVVLVPWSLSALVWIVRKLDVRWRRGPLIDASQIAPLLLLIPSLALAAEPHPAVVRVTVQDRDGANSMGSGVYVAECTVEQGKEAGVVLTNHHVIKDRGGAITVTFPDGFSSQASVRGSDPRADLAAIVVWRPNVSPMPVAEAAPQQGERLWIAGYGGSPTVGYLEQSGQARYEFVGDILTVAGCQARQGDSGGPIINSQGELAGVLDAAGSGFTIGANLKATTVFLTQWGCAGGVCGRPMQQQPQYQQRPVVTTPVPRPQQPRQDYALPYRDNTAERLTKIEEAIKALGANQGCKCDGLQERVTALEKQPIIHGKDGKDGKDGKSVDAAEVAALVLKEIGDIRCKCSPPAPDPSEAPHYVLVADQTAEYWRWIEGPLKQAQGVYHGITVAPVPPFEAGPMPQLVEYRGGVPYRAIPTRDKVVTMLNLIAQNKAP